METILCAAIWYDDDGKHYPHQEIYGVDSGFVICGFRHHNIIGVLSTNNKYRNDGKEYKTTQGFITSHGRFVTREEAAEIAYNSGQIKEQVKRLFSEDLY
jgi:hypothetical protein